MQVLPDDSADGLDGRLVVVAERHHDAVPGMGLPQQAVERVADDARLVPQRHDQVEGQLLPARGTGSGQAICSPAFGVRQP